MHNLFKKEKKYKQGDECTLHRTNSTSLFKAILYGSSNVSCRHLELMRVKNNGAFFHGLCYLAVENYLFKHS